jgi:hypothetical protein
MNIEGGAWYAVISGDFIGFSPLSAPIRQALYRLVRRGSERLQEVFPAVLPAPVDMYRGDAWQMVLVRPEKALRAGLLFRAFIRGRAPLRHVDVRMAIGVGPVDYVPAGEASAGDGAAFRRSGRRLEAMASPRAGTFRFAMDDSPVSLALDGMAFLTGTLATGWTQSQAVAVEGALAGKTQQEIAAGWTRPVSYQAVGGHLKRAGWPAVRHAVAMYEASIASLIHSK